MQTEPTGGTMRPASTCHTRVRRLLLLAGLLFLLLPVPLQATNAEEAALANELEVRLRQPFNGDLDALLKKGVIRALVPFSKSTFFIDNGEQRGSSVDMTQALTKYLVKAHGKKAKGLKIMLIPTSLDTVFTELSKNRGDIALGNLTVTPEREKLVAFSTPLLADVREVPVTAAGVSTLTAPEELSGRTVHVRKSSSHHETLLALNTRLVADGKTPVEIVVAEDWLDDEDLMELVAAGGIEMVIVDEHQADLWLKVFDGLKKHPDAAIGNGEHIAIAVRKNAPALLKEVNAFAGTVKKGTLLGNIIFRKYLQEADYLKDMHSLTHAGKLEALETLFRKYSKTYSFDWLLVAAQSFQESRFNPKARNPSGAVGLMQIKPSTAAGTPINIKGVESDPEKNVHAGVKYLRFLADRYFGELSVDAPNQAFFALAAYNAGPSRFKRMRKQAIDSGYDPDKWFGNMEWIVARHIGRQPVDYVGNIYQYFVVFNSERTRRKENLAASRKLAAQPAK
ncbi:transporter substrate-binding domain-containing protein [Rhodobacterales bacterium]|nr:transporter substrate-binding domain-containing protein [Rhodobacterales bacterium]